MCVISMYIGVWDGLILDFLFVLLLFYFYFINFNKAFSQVFCTNICGVVWGIEFVYHILYSFRQAFYIYISARFL